MNISNNSILQKLQTKQQIEDRLIDLDHKLYKLSETIISLKNIIKETQKETLELIEKIKTVFV